MKILTNNPFTRDDICIGRMWYKLSCVVGEESMIFFFHGSGPVRIKESRFVVLEQEK
jgi:hypothetical protein